MSLDDHDTDAVIDAMAAFAGLVVMPQYRAGVAAHLKAAKAIAADVLAFETDDEAEPASVFRS